MKKFVIIARNMSNGNCIVVTEIKANTRKEAQQIAMRDYYQYLEPNEQMVVANDRQWDEIWKDKVSATDELVDSLKIKESDDDEFYESRKPRRTKRIRTERYIGKHYWSYRYDHPFIDRINDNDSWFTDRNIRNIPLIAMDDPDDCYSEDPWRVAVEDSDYNGKPLFCTEEQAYKRLKDYLNSTMYERRNDL